MHWARVLEREQVLAKIVAVVDVHGHCGGAGDWRGELLTNSMARSWKDGTLVPDEEIPRVVFEK
jgi:hypothetical protein